MFEYLRVISDIAFIAQMTSTSTQCTAFTRNGRGPRCRNIYRSSESAMPYNNTDTYCNVHRARQTRLTMIDDILRDIKPRPPPKPEPVITDLELKERVQNIKECFLAARECKILIANSVNIDQRESYSTQLHDAYKSASKLSFAELKCAEPTECPVCLTEVVSVVQLLCTHKLCHKCLPSTLKSTCNKCPLCKRGVYTLREQNN